MNFVGSLLSCDSGRVLRRASGRSSPIEYPAQSACYLDETMSPDAAERFAADSLKASAGWPKHLKSTLPDHKTARVRVGQVHRRLWLEAGVRAEDGPIRMMALRKYGAVTLTKKKWQPIWDRSNRQGRHEAVGRIPLDEAVVRRDPCRLPGADKKIVPEDYKRILEWFPFVEAEVRRHERAGLVKLAGERWSVGHRGRRRHVRHSCSFGEGRDIRGQFRRRAHRLRGHVGLHQQAQGVKTMTARVLSATQAVNRWYSLLWTPTQQPFRCHSLTHPTRNTLQMLRGEIWTELCLLISERCCRGSGA